MRCSSFRTEDGSTRDNINARIKMNLSRGVFSLTLGMEQPKVIVGHPNLPPGWTAYYSLQDEKWFYHNTEDNVRLFSLVFDTGVVSNDFESSILSGIPQSLSTPAHCPNPSPISISPRLRISLRTGLRITVLIGKHGITHLRTRVAYVSS